MSSSPRFLTALPAYNELLHVNPAADQVMRYAGDVLAVADGPPDGTRALLGARSDCTPSRHHIHRVYTAALKTAFNYAVQKKYDVLVTIDCDGQHTPRRICSLVEATREADLVSGSRYLCTKEVARQA